MHFWRTISPAYRKYCENTKSKLTHQTLGKLIETKSITNLHLIRGLLHEIKRVRRKFQWLIVLFDDEISNRWVDYLKDYFTL